MDLIDLITCVVDGPPQQALPQTRVHAVVHQTQRVAPGDVFVAIHGKSFDGHDFGAEAARRGAIAVVAERPCDTGSAACVVVPNARQAFARLCNALAGEPTRHFGVTAVTGTNGKTTTTYLIEHALRLAGRATGLVGTVEIRYPGVARPSKMTTPDADELQGVFQEMLQGGVEECVMEASSHALAGYRLDASHLDAAIFTNIQRDHLDHHGTFESYFEAKRRIFDLLEASSKPRKVAIVNADDEWGQTLLKMLPGEVVSYGLERPADVHGDWHQAGAGSRVQVSTPHGSFSARLPMGGRHNASNALAATAGALARGIPLEVIQRTLEDPPVVPGRRHRVASEAPFAVYVDFAHNPGGMEAMLEDMRVTHPRSRIALVFGAKGRDSDREKRRQMGAAASRGADFVFVTSDDPYDEDPDAIAAAILEGVEDRSSVLVQHDRRRAMREAFRLARPGDVVVVAGRGPEPNQMGRSGPVPFDDYAVAVEELAALRREPHDARAGDRLAVRWRARARSRILKPSRA